MAGMVEEVPATGRYRWLRRLWPILAAVGAGLLLLTAFPPIDLWWIAPFGVALLGLATYRRGLWAGAGLGMITGLTLLIPLLSWAGGFVGPVWLFLPFGEACYFALLGALSALASPALNRWPWSWPLVTGSLWVLQEALRDRTPFGGFPWGRLAFSQGDSPLLGLAALGGAPLVTFGAAFTGGLVALAVLVLVTSPRPYRWPTVRPAVAAVVVALVATLAPLPLLGSTSSAETTARVAIVQGNVPRLGLDFNAQRRAVLDNHVNATLELARRVDAGQTPKPDLVIWPENSSDIDPLRNADARELINQAARAIDAPILVGGLQDGPGPMDLRNIGLVWDPISGPGQSYTKRHPVPFAEYIPMRSFVRHITTKVDLVRRDFVAGEMPGVLTMGPATIGDVICFEVAYDEVVRDTVTNGAQLLVVQTNNATFNEAEARQQLAMVRLRAVEHGRDALMSSTVGVSAFVDAAGNVYDATQFNAKAVIERTVVLRTARTMATRLGFLPELALAALGLGFLAAGIVLRRRRTADAWGSGNAGTAAENNRTDVAHTSLGVNGSNRAELAGTSAGVGPLNTRPSGTGPRVVADEAKG
jgi:apolipoprotein N-acyltransferase